MRIVEVAVALGAAGAFVATAALAHDAHPGGTTAADPAAQSFKDDGFWGSPSAESQDDGGWFGGGDDEDDDGGWLDGGDDEDQGGDWFGGSAGTHES